MRGHGGWRRGPFFPGPWRGPRPFRPRRWGCLPFWLLMLGPWLALLLLARGLLGR